MVSKGADCKISAKELRAECRPQGQGRTAQDGWMDDAYAQIPSLCSVLLSSDSVDLEYGRILSFASVLAP